MNPKEFFSRLLLHASYALTCLVGCLIIGEWLIPGSVLTHIHLMRLIILTLVIIFLSPHTKSNV